MGQIGIVAGTRQLDLALEFVSYYTAAENVFPPHAPHFVPARPPVGVHADFEHITGIDIRPYLPTYPENLTRRC